jgi:hypothetical protein
VKSEIKTHVARIVIYADDRTDLGKEALKLLEDSAQYVVRIPVSGGLPFATKGRSRYDGLEEIKVLAEELRGKGDSDDT